MKTIQISDKLVGKNQPTFIIAEAGVNHNGNLELAKKLVDVAVGAYADAVKFQTFRAEDVSTKDVEAATYAKENIGKDVKQVCMLKSLALEYDDFKILKKYCDKKGIIFLSTPHSFDAIDFLEDLVPAYKFGSGDITNLPSLKYAAKKGKPIIIGTGMSTLNEVKEAIDAIKSENNEQIIALHCTTNYPCPVDEVNLQAMVTMQQELDCLIGYSDHTLGLSAPIMAKTLGATVIEKHFTVDRNLPGPDHKSSLEPDELKEMVKQIRDAEKILGSFDKKPTKSEEKIMPVARKSLVAKHDIKKEDVLTKNDIEIKRPGTGLKPNDLHNLIGRKAKVNIKKESLLKKDQFRKRILITGGAGFIGSSLIRELAGDYDIVSLDLSHGIAKDSVNAEFIDGSILNEDVLDKAMKNIDVVIHLAGGGGESKCLQDPAMSVLSNIIGTELVVKHAILNNISKIIFSSSIYTYSSYKKRKLPVKETDKQMPDTFYGSLKLACEEIIKNSGLDYVIVRFSNIYGVGSDIHSQLGGAIGNFIDATVNNTEITVFNMGKNKIDYLNVLDVTTAIRTLIEQDIKNEIFNLGSNSPITIFNLAKLVVNVAKRSKVQYDKDIFIKKTNVLMLADLWSDTSKAYKKLLWTPKIGLEQGIAEMIDFRRKSQ